MAERKIVYVGDPALDVREMKIEGPGGYAETRDPSLVRKLPGRDPHWFVIRYLTARESIYVDERGLPLRKARAAVSVGLVRVECPNGQTLLPNERVPTMEGGGEALIWSDGALDMLVRKFGKFCMYDIGAAIMEMDDSPGEAFASGDAVRFKLLPSSLAALEENRRRLAASHTSEPVTPS